MPESTTESNTASGMWAVVEIFGHKKLAGKITAPDGSDWAGGMLRIDVHGEDGESTTQFYGEKAIFSITPTTEAICRRLGTVLHHPEPVSRWELQLPEARAASVQTPDPWEDYDPDEDIEP